MNNEAVFYQKCTDYHDYDMRYGIFGSIETKNSFNIIKTIVMNKKEYKDFIEHFLYYWDFLNEIKGLPYISEDKIVNCILVTENNSDGFLVYTSGFPYARYVARWNGGDCNVSS